MRDAAQEWRNSWEECSDQRDARRDVCEDLGENPYQPEIDPANFISNPLEIGTSVTPNPYFSLVPGTTWEYENAEDEETITVSVLEETKVIQDVTCIVVRDVVREGEDSELVEDTLDWYAQDIDGNVWYFGEIAKNYEDGELIDLDGSWKAGEDGAKAGIIMKAPSQADVGDVYRQEFLLGDAEDMAKILSLSESVSISYGSFDDVLKTLDYSPLEPDVVEHKFYAPGVGLIKEIKPDTGEVVELVSMTP